MAKLQAPKGVLEYVPPDSATFLEVQASLLDAAVIAGYRPILLPIFEDTDLYVRGVGEATDVVSKEMYTFDDRAGRSLTLRPEGTAGVVRAVIEHGLDRQGRPVKLSYAGPFFRAERPQQGRYRQFNQVGIEAIGSEDPALDAEVIAVAAEGFASLGLTQVRLLINSLGDADSKAEYAEVLKRFLATLDLDSATRERAAKNPLRVLDDKRHDLQQMLRDAPKLSDVLSAGARSHAQAVAEYLAALKIPFTQEPRLVRGLDYYTSTTFEFVHEGLGAQSAVGGGGRYDGLVESLGGAPLPGIGYGIGVDRVVLACKAEGVSPVPAAACDVYVISPASFDPAAVTLCATLRGAGLRVDRSFGGRSMKGALRAANRLGARFVVMLTGSQTGNSNEVVVKDMVTSAQQTVEEAQVVQVVREGLT